MQFCVVLLWWFDLSYNISVALFWCCTIVNLASPYMVRLTKETAQALQLSVAMNHFDGWYSWDCQMITRLYSPDPSVQSWWQIPYVCFLFLTATVPQMIFYVMFDIFKVNFLQIPSMFTTITQKSEVIDIGPKVQITPPNPCNIANGDSSRLVKAKWQMSPFLILSRHIGL